MISQIVGIEGYNSQNGQPWTALLRALSHHRDKSRGLSNNFKKVARFLNVGIEGQYSRNFTNHCCIILLVDDPPNCLGTDR
jgi:hypothetical protein